ncbi:MAG: hypothetical protein PVF33_05650 [Candidatus Latescibacterota bacterium]|jgi:hypothetical protein
MEIETLREALNRTERFIEAEQCRGYDPYDGLTSPLFRLPVMRSVRLGRFAFQQVLKRLPFQTRPLFGIPKGYNPVTLALVLQGHVYREMSGDGQGSRADRIHRLVGELDRLVTPGWSGACWGYDFPWESRYASFPAGHPTVVATGIVTNALFLAWQLQDIPSAGNLVTRAVPFVTDDLHRTPQRDSFCWSYSPTDRQVVLNATAKGARLCVQANRIAADGTLAELARSALDFVAGQQADDGGWPYSLGDARGWRDNFHTGYILDCMHEYGRLTGDSRFAPNVRKGIQYYAGRFFHREVVPKYYDNRLYPIDATACAQSILTLVRFGEIGRATGVAAWCLDNLALPDGSFKYQIHRRYENRLPYMRWSVAWMYAALCRLELALAGPADEQPD